MLENLSVCLSNIKPHCCYTLNKQSMGKNIVSCGFGTISAILPATDQSGQEGKEGEDFLPGMPQPYHSPSQHPSLLYPGLLPPILIIP